MEEFIHVVSHDIKEPVRKILLFSSHLLSAQNLEALDKLEQKRLHSVHSSAQRLNALVDDLVKYSLSTSKTEPSRVDLTEILNEVIEDLTVNIRESQATIHSKNLAVIDGSPIQLRRLFANLLSNAIKYKQKDLAPVIKIRCDIKDHIDPHFPNKKFNVISVKDNGIGMKANEINKIFIMFQRLHMQGEYSGNGIGLAICKKIMENHLGKIEVESVPNEGSVFKLFFPVKK
jgi:light-regulated signal transduction histidine kinase (bacteriophytochrome)